MSSPIRIEAHREPGEPIVRERTAEPCAAVIFGITGDLAHRKIVPALYNLAQGGSLPAGTSVIGFSRSVGTADTLRARLGEAVGKFSRTRPLDPAVWDAFAAGIECVPGSVDDPAAYAALRSRLAEVEARGRSRGNRLFYFATPPEAFPPILSHLKAAGLIYDRAAAPSPWSRVVIEKPFGRDLASARELNRLCADVLAERQTFRIDHYLGKETVQNILLFRFGNAIFEHLWNRKYVDHVQITAAEDIGVEGRGAFYDHTGVLRDVVQNHLLQVLAVCTMEPPTTFGADDVRDEKVQVLRALRPITDGDVVRHVVAGRYRGYRQEQEVAAGSETPTFVAMRLMLDNWRWQGVPFYVRAGKRLARRCTEVSVHFQTIPLCLFGRDDVCQRIEPNVLTLRLQPDEGISLRMSTKVPGDDLEAAAVKMDFSYARAFDRPLSDAYERLLLDCMRGDATLFARRDEIEWAWTFCDPILEAWASGRGAKTVEYEPGSAGPEEAETLIQRDGRRWTDLVSRPA